MLRCAHNAGQATATILAHPTWPGRHSGGDLLLMLDVKCFEPGALAATDSLAVLSPHSIRELLEQHEVKKTAAIPLVALFDVSLGILAP